MRLSQRIAQEFARFIDANYVVKNIYPNASIESIPMVGSMLASYYKKISDVLMAKMGDPDLKQKKVQSAVGFCQLLVEFAFLKLDGQHESPQQTPEKIKIILRQFVNEYSNSSNQNQVPIAKTLLEKARAAVDQKIMAEDKLTAFDQSLDAIGSLNVAEVHFMRLLYILIEKEIEKIGKIEAAHDKTEGSYDLVLDACKLALRDMCHLTFYGNATYVTTGLSWPNTENSQDKFAIITDRYCRSKRNNSLIRDLPEYLTEILVEQFLAATVSSAEYQYHLNTLMPTVVLPFPTAAQQGCVIIDSKIRGNKRSALYKLSELMKENLDLVESYALNEERCQKFLQSVLYSISYIEKETGFSLAELTAPVMHALIKIKYRSPTVSSTVPTVSTEDQHSPWVVVDDSLKSDTSSNANSTATSNATATSNSNANVAATAAASIIIRSHSTADNPYSDTKQKQEHHSLKAKEVISRGRKKILSRTERAGMIGVNVNQVMSFIQRQAKECSIIIDDTCIQDSIPTEFGGVELAQSHFKLDHTSVCLSTKAGWGERITAADLFFEVLNGFLVNDKNHVNDLILEQDPEIIEKQLQELFSSEINRITKLVSEKNRVLFKEGCYPEVLKGCLKFLSELRVLNPYADWYLQAKIAEHPNPADFFLINLMEAYLKFRKDYCFLNMQRAGVEFSVYFDLPSEGISTEVIDAVCSILKDSIEDLMGELGEKGEFVLITSKNLLYCLKDIASRNAVDLQKLVTKLEKDLIAHIDQKNSMQSLVPIGGEGTAVIASTKAGNGYFPSGGIATVSASPIPISAIKTTGNQNGVLSNNAAVVSTTTTSAATASATTAYSSIAAVASAAVTATSSSATNQVIYNSAVINPKFVTEAESIQKLITPPTAVIIANANISTNHAAPDNTSDKASETLTLSHHNNLQGSIPTLSKSLDSAASTTPLIASIASFTTAATIAHLTQSSEKVNAASENTQIMNKLGL